MGDLGDDAIVKTWKFGTQKGRVVGMQSADKTRGWRIYFDPKTGEAHCNWCNKKETGKVPFVGDQNMVDGLIDQLERTYN